MERTQKGIFTNLEDLINRTAATVEQLVLLIRLQTLRFTGKPKEELLWKTHLLLGHKENISDNRALLFQEPAKKFTLPALCHTALGNAYEEMELLGFPVTLSYFDLLQTLHRGDVLAKNLGANIGQFSRMLGILVTTKSVRTVKGEIMQFGTFLDVAGDFFVTVHFPQSLQKWPFKGPGYTCCMVN